MGTLSLVSGGDQEWSDAPGPHIIRAVAFPRTATPLFLGQGEEDKAGGLLLPHHLPEVHHCVGQGNWTGAIQGERGERYEERGIRSKVIREFIKYSLELCLFYSIELWAMAKYVLPVSTKIYLVW